MQYVVVGNGTSLSVEQLDQIIGIPSIACNRINLIYPDTKWRPTIYVHPETLAPDTPYIQENIDAGIECYVAEHYPDIKPAENTHWIKECFHHLHNFDSPEVPDEWHFPQPCSFGGSVNFAMQIAVMKGATEIILIGCDLIYKTRNRSHFDPRYEHGQEQPPFYASRNAFFGHIQALNWIRRKGKNINVINATRGGMLELWPRAELADVIK